MFLRSDPKKGTKLGWDQETILRNCFMVLLSVVPSLDNVHPIDADGNNDIWAGRLLLAGDCQIDNLIDSKKGHCWKLGFAS